MEQGNNGAMEKVKEVASSVKETIQDGVEKLMGNHPNDTQTPDDADTWTGKEIEADNSNKNAFGEEKEQLTTADLIIPLDA